MSKIQFFVGLAITNGFAAWVNHQVGHFEPMAHVIFSSVFLALFAVNLFLFKGRTGSLIVLILMNLVVFFTEMVTRSGSMLWHLLPTALVILILKGTELLDRRFPWAIPVAAFITPIIILAIAYQGLTLEYLKFPGVWAKLLFFSALLYGLLSWTFRGVSRQIAVAVALLAITGAAAIYL